MDVCDISRRDSFRGEVRTVKVSRCYRKSNLSCVAPHILELQVIGTLALIDEGETDWKVITIDVRDPQAEEMNDIDDLARLRPGFSFATYEWFEFPKLRGILFKIS